MNRIVKLALGFFFFVVLLGVLTPTILRTETNKRDSVAGGVKALGPAFFKVQWDQGGAVLWARPRGRRGYHIVLNGNRDYEWRLELDRFKSPVPVPVKVGSRLYFQYRHFGYQYHVTNISGKGVSIEVGGDRSSLFSRNKTVFLPWK